MPKHEPVLPEIPSVLDGEPQSPNSLPPGLVGWGLGWLPRPVRKVVVPFFWIACFVAAVLWGAAFIKGRVEGVAEAVQKKTEDAVAAQEKKVRRQGRDIAVLQSTVNRIEGKLDVLGEANLTKEQLADPRWRPAPAIEPEDEGDDQ